MGQAYSEDDSSEPQQDCTLSRLLSKKTLSLILPHSTQRNCADSRNSHDNDTFSNKRVHFDSALYPPDITPAFQQVSPKTYDSIDEQKKYELPGREEHIDRIQLRHVLFRYVWQGNFSSPLDEELNQGIRVLDIGCGSGSWVLDMSVQYPNSTFIGIDMCSDYFPSNNPASSTNPSLTIPPNAHFQKLNVLDGLPFDDGEFDFVHLRFLVQYLTESQWAMAIREMTRITRSKGWIEIMGPIPQNYKIQWAGRLGVYTLTYFSMAFNNMSRVLPGHMNISEDEYYTILERFHGECELFRTLAETFRICCRKK
ncbi:16292_t:CDS:2 [Acaulospora colombiana]|uniref:16292_t:CDS:1 n=1 Tax=Acaulospora colombiana TaxID=27376 RepID=A0ACA9LW55_9GLOM|nr:16292_t:CDS:2 [Acaulospora colombiana]